MVIYYNYAIACTL